MRKKKDSLDYSILSNGSFQVNGILQFLIFLRDYKILILFLEGTKNGYLVYYMVCGYENSFPCYTLHLFYLLMTTPII